MDPLLPLSEQSLFAPLDNIYQLLEGDALLSSIVRGFLFDVKDVFAFEVARLGDAEEPAEYLGLGAQNRFDLCGSPDEKLAFFAFTVGIRGRIETTFWAGHLS